MNSLYNPEKDSEATTGTVEKSKISISTTETFDALKNLERGVLSALESYSNVHRGSGYNSVVTTFLFEKARDIVLDYLGLDKKRYIVIFCTKRSAEKLQTHLESKNFRYISSSDIGLPLSVVAMAVKRTALPKEIPFHTGGGTARLISPKWIIRAAVPERFEAGTPAIINVIAFAHALILVKQFGKEIFQDVADGKLSARDILYDDELLPYSGNKLPDELRKTLIGRGTKVPTFDGFKPFINLDNSASTPTFMPVWNAVRQTWRQPVRVQKEIIEEVRSLCARFLESSKENYDFIFTSNATEAINLAAESFSRGSGEGSDHVVLSTVLEHSSNDLPWRLATRSPLIRLSVDSEGFPDLNEMETLLKTYNRDGLHGNRRIKLVALTGASNVLGIYNDLAEISRIVHRYGAHLLVDAAQLVPHRKVGMESSGIDYLAFSAHKMYAPFGCGMLVVRKGLLRFSPEEMEQIRLSGEENAGGIAALGKAIVLLDRIGMDVISEEEHQLMLHALHGMKKVDGLTLFGLKDPDSPRINRKGGILVFSLKNMMSDKVAEELSLRGGIGVRYGCHCAHILVKQLVGISPALELFQGLVVSLFPKLNLPGLVRVSLGIENTQEEVDILVHTLEQISSQPRTSGHRETKKQINDLVEAVAQKVYSIPA